MTTFSDILDEGMLLALAGNRAYDRGGDSFEHGLVHYLAEYDDQITAGGERTYTYQVNLAEPEDDLQATSEISSNYCSKLALTRISISAFTTWLSLRSLQTEPSQSLATGTPLTRKSLTLIDPIGWRAAIQCFRSSRQFGRRQQLPADYRSPKR